eukprot:TRINITY_DN1470_c0_g1_i1.p3 TRINITY_DN1470_c0_g1~~TRINITY_DN1470_c0_g1_i1.p3  ORF type:complete len:137 (+),score=3.33 TRINITY_DN1470_c0_g1_i1:37-411(+)
MHEYIQTLYFKLWTVKCKCIDLVSNYININYSRNHAFILPLSSCKQQCKIINHQSQAKATAKVLPKQNQESPALKKHTDKPLKPITALLIRSYMDMPIRRRKGLNVLQKNTLIKAQAHLANKPI